MSAAVCEASGTWSPCEFNTTTSVPSGTCDRSLEVGAVVAFDAPEVAVSCELFEPPSAGAVGLAETVGLGLASVAVAVSVAASVAVTVVPSAVGVALA